MKSCSSKRAQRWTFIWIFYFTADRMKHSRVLLTCKDKETAGLVEGNGPIGVEGPPTGSGNCPPIVWDSRKTSGRLDQIKSQQRQHKAIELAFVTRVAQQCLWQNGIRQFLEKSSSLYRLQLDSFDYIRRRGFNCCRCYSFRMKDSLTFHLWT